MADKQATFGDFDEDGVDESLKHDYSGRRLAKPHPSMLSDDAAYEDTLSCPWCLHPSEKLPDAEDGFIGCPNCDSRIPADADWYQRGDKIVN